MAPMELVEMVYSLPARVDERKRVKTACYIVSVMGNCTGVAGDEHWDVYWRVGGNPLGVWLTRHGVYVSDDVDGATANLIIGYCARYDIPWFDSDTIVQLARGVT